MRLWIITAVLVAGLKIGMAQAPVEPDTNIGCVERIQMPEYTPLARQARIEGTIIASVILGPQGSVQAVNTKFLSQFDHAKPLMSIPAERVIREGSFRSDCGGKTVILIIDFKIAGQATDRPRHSVAFSAPNKFWIVSTPPILQESIN